MPKEDLILLTGGGGLVASEVARRLAPRANVRLAHRSGTHRISSVRFDFLQPDTFAGALHDVTRVFLLRPPQLAHAQHHFGPFVDAMERSDVQQVVFLSVRGADKNPLLPHRGIERLLERSTLSWTHVRPNDFMQNLTTVHRDDILQRSEIWAPAGDGRTSYVDLRDVAEFVSRVLTEPGHERRAYTLTGNEALGLEQVAAVLSQVLGRPIRYRCPSIMAFLRHLGAAGHPLAFGLVMTGVYTVARLGLAAGTSPELERLLGRKPTSFGAFASDYASVWRPIIER